MIFTPGPIARRAPPAHNGRMQENPKLLHLGCGLCAPPQWVNVDGSSNAWLAQHPVLKKIVRLLHLAPKSQLDIPWPTNIRIANLTKPLPWANHTFDAVFASHTLEHVHRSQAVELLKECARVLKPGGACRMLLPDLQSLIDEYLGLRKVEGYPPGPADDPARRLCQKLLMRPEAGARGGFLIRLLRSRGELNAHKWMYDAPSLVKLFQEAGFINVSQRGFRETQIPHIDQVESEGRVLNGAGVIVEGTKA